MRKWDIFGAPIGVTYEGAPSYKTQTGGIVTLLLIIFIGSNTFASILGAILDPKYTYHIDSAFNELASGIDDPWVMDTQ